MRFIIACIALAVAVSACAGKDSDPKASMPEKEKTLRDQIAQYPDSMLLKENLIQYFRDNSDYGDAISTTTDALKKDSLNDRLYDILATLQFENGDTLHSIRAFEKAVAINPQPEYIISLGSLYAQTKNPLALALADALLQTPAANAQLQAVFIKGLYYSYTGEKEKAISYFDGCLKMDYRNMLAYREKAICLYDLGKYGAALELLQKAVTVQNTFDEAYYWMGRCFEKLGDKKNAIAAYQQALQLDNDYIEAKDALAHLGIKY